MPRLTDSRYRVAALVTVVFALLITACGSSSDTTIAPSTRAALIKPASAITLVIKNYAYLPANATIPRGATVTVRNEDNAIHTLTADNMEFNTGNVTQGLPATFTAPTQPGRYPYHCLIHRAMRGVLTVY